MRESVTKQVIINALYFYQMNADYEDQVECLQMFDCEPYRSVTLETDADRRATLFEKVIQDALSRLDSIGDKLCSKKTINTMLLLERSFGLGA